MKLVTFNGIKFILTSDTSEALGELHRQMPAIMADVTGMRDSQSGEQKYFNRQDSWNIKELFGDTTVVFHSKSGKQKKKIPQVITFIEDTKVSNLGLVYELGTMDNYCGNLELLNFWCNLELSWDSPTLEIENKEIVSPVKMPVVKMGDTEIEELEELETYSDPFVYTRNNTSSSSYNIPRIIGYHIHDGGVPPAGDESGHFSDLDDVSYSSSLAINGYVLYQYNWIRRYLVEVDRWCHMHTYDASPPPGQIGAYYADHHDGTFTYTFKGYKANDNICLANKSIENDETWTDAVSWVAVLSETRFSQEDSVISGTWKDGYFSLVTDIITDTGSPLNISIPYYIEPYYTTYKVKLVVCDVGDIYEFELDWLDKNNSDIYDSAPPTDGYVNCCRMYRYGNKTVVVLVIYKVYPYPMEIPVPSSVKYYAYYDGNFYESEEFISSMEDWCGVPHYIYSNAIKGIGKARACLVTNLTSKITKITSEIEE
jgi:hypothetical protein